MPSSLEIDPPTVMDTLAEHFHRDAVDFATRFDMLWEAGPLMHKMGRTKSFVDLLMGCECALKCHGFLGHRSEQPRNVYKTIRAYGHRMDKLADYACFLEDRAHYDMLKLELKKVSVFIRYSLDANETFFPSFQDRASADLSYSHTIGSNTWVLQIRATLENLISSAARCFGGEVSTDIDEWLGHEQEMCEFAKACL